MINKRTIWLIIFGIIILLAAYLRLYRINDYMAFLGDEGRDALIVKRMIVDHNFTLLGPITSVGLMHLGPIYYYFMAPFLLLSRLDPVGPAIMVALFSVATVLLIWKIAQEFFDVRTGAIAALLYALSPLVIAYSHSSWNPNILPFWALLIIYALLQVIISQRFKWMWIVGAALGVVLQLHYVALVFIPIIIVSLSLIRFRIPRKWLAGGFIGTIITIAPFILFEVRHQFINTITVFYFVTRSGDAKTFTVMTFFNKFWDLTVRLFWRLVIIKNAEISVFFLATVLLLCFLYLIKEKNSRRKMAIKLLLVWYVVGISVLSLYTGNIYDYYLMFAFPLPFLLTGIAFAPFLKNWATKLPVLGLVLVIAIWHLQVTPISREPNRLAAQTYDIAQFILNKVGKEPYNFALIAGGNSDHAYRYFLEIGGNTPVEIKNPANDPQRHTVTKQLYIVCEEKICQPLGHPLWEIAGYGRAEIADEWSVGLFKVFKLVPYTGN
jgi:4-amino-4-deoxy-L-arabinose transferase-like glycosyltransferase